MMDSREVTREGKENKKPGNPEMNPNDEIDLATAKDETKIHKVDGFSLPHLKVGPETTAKGRSPEDAHHSPVHFPSLRLKTSDSSQKVSRQNAPVTGILFLPSIL